MYGHQGSNNTCGLMDTSQGYRHFLPNPLKHNQPMINNNGEGHLIFNFHHETDMKGVDNLLTKANKELGHQQGEYFYMLCFRDSKSIKYPFKAKIISFIYKGGRGDWGSSHQ